MTNIRIANISDIPELKNIFRNTILEINKKDYPENEIEDWASCGEDDKRWEKLISELYFIVAENDKKMITGFSSVSDTGYLHSMFVHKDFQRQKIATLLYNELENYAKINNITEITSEVSITAKPFFIKQGFIVEEEQKRKANKFFMTNYKMRKKLFKDLNEMTNEELWEIFPVILSEYEEYWKENYISEKQQIEKNIGKENILRINHIGSTSVPGLLSKPTIDILLEINSNTDIRKLKENMITLGYIFSAQPLKPQPHMMFMKGYTPQGFKGQVFHVHVRYGGDWNELYFRDFLSDHPEIAEEYANLKIELKKKYEHNRDAYTDAKAGFISEVTNLARSEYKNRYKIDNQ